MFQTNPGGVKLFSDLNTLFCSNKLCIAVATLKHSIECLHLRRQKLCKFTGTRETFKSKKRFNSHSAGLRHRRLHHFVVLGHQYAGLDLMC